MKLDRPEALNIHFKVNPADIPVKIETSKKNVDIHIPEEHLTIYYPFGPRIMTGQITNEKVAAMNELCDKVLASPDRVPYNDYLAGIISDEYRLDRDQLSSIDMLDTLQWFAESYIYQCKYYNINEKEVGRDVSCRVAISDRDTWFNDQKPGEYNPPHNHTNMEIDNCGNLIISGVLYLKIPEYESRKSAADYRNNSDGNLILLSHSSAHRLDSGSFQYTPEVGNIILFPGHLTHMVMPFLNKNGNIRRSVAFNAHYQFLIKGQENDWWNYETCRRCETRDKREGIV